MKIADELSSIRAELNTLKKEFADIRAESVSAIKTDIKAEPSHGGFFAEDDDEKIALTGDEMEDILTSVDFAEEEEPAPAADFTEEEEPAPAVDFAEEEEPAPVVDFAEEEELTPADDFAEKEELSFDALREADEAALKELSEQNESSVAEEVAEEINIDFANLGIDLDNEMGEAQEELPPLEAADDDFDIPSFDTSPFDETTELEALDQQEEITPELSEPLAPLEPLEPIEEDDELRSIRLEGAIPLTPAPDNTIYLEEDPFALDHHPLEDTPHDAEALSEKPPLEDAVPEDISLDAEALSEEPSLEDTVPEDISLDADALSGEPSLDDIVLEDISLDVDALEESPLEETVPEEPAPEEPVLEDIVSEETIPEEPALEDAVSEEAVPEEPALEDTVSEDAAPGENALFEDTGGLTLDDTGFDIGFDDFVDDFSIEDSPFGEETGETPSLDAGASELSETAIDKPAVETAAVESPVPLEEAVSDEQAFDVGSLELSDTGIDEPVFETDTIETDTPETDTLGSPLELEEEAGNEQGFDVDSMELSEAVIDEPDLSAGLVEPPLEEPVLGDISFQDDLSLGMDGFETDDFGTEEVEAAADDSETKSAKSGDHVNSIDDSFAQVIPEGFEKNARETAIPVDDDLEALTDDLSIAGEEISPPDAAAKTAEPGAGGDAPISPRLKSDLKNVLAYMDHLLESLPEDKIEEFAQSEYFDTYKKIFKELGLV